MRINFENGLSRDFPMTVFELEDALDRLGTDNSVVDFRISEHENPDLPRSLCRDFTADIYKLNLFAQRYESLDDAELAAMKSLLITNPDSSIDDLLLMTYGLDSVLMFLCFDYTELGEIVIENEMMPELESCSDEILELLDREKIGRLMCERNGGVFIDGYYCVPSNYEAPDINIEFGRPENCFFRLLIAPIKENNVPDYSSAQWISLPFDEENQDIDFEKMTCVKWESSLPALSQNQLQIGKIYELNALSKELSGLSHANFVKLKAVMESQRFEEISDAIECINCLDNYGFTENICNEGEFGREYLSRNLPNDFDLSVLDNIDLENFGSKILCRKGALSTSYGVVHGENMDLFSAVTIQRSQQLDEDLDEDYEENFEMEIGGMSL